MSYVIVKDVVVFNCINISITCQLLCISSREILNAWFLRVADKPAGICENAKTLFRGFKMENDISVTIL